MIFRFVMTHPSGERRHVTIDADSQEEAVAFLEQSEREKVAFQAPLEEVAALELGLREGTLKPHERARLLTHRQEVAYKIGKERS